MIWLRQLVLYLHILAAAFWVGEILFVALVVGPMGRTLPREERVRLFRETGRRTLPWIWTAIAVLVVTGIGNLYFLRIGPRELTSTAFYRTSFGWLLAAKIVGALGMFAHAAVHDFVYGRRTRRIRAAMLTATAEERPALEADYARARRGASATGRANLVLALVVIALAAGLGVRT
jgi:putative copper export protein